MPVRFWSAAPISEDYMRYIDFEEEDVSVPIPDDWVIDVEPLGFQAWAHDYWKEIGVSETGRTKEEAIKKLADRMHDWLTTR